MSTPWGKKSSKDGPKTKMLRYLGNNEKHQLAMYMQGHHRGTTLSCQYYLPIRLTFVDADRELKSLVRTAVAAVILKHPILQVGIAGADTKAPRFVQLDSLQLSNHIEWRHILDDDQGLNLCYYNLLGPELDAEFHELEKRPGWRVVIQRCESNRTFAVMFVFNPPHSDGVSAKIFHQHLLEEFIAQIETGTDDINRFIDGDILKLPSSPPELPPPIEQVMKLPVTPKLALKSLWHELKPPIFRREASLAKWVPIQLTPYKTRPRDFTIWLDNVNLIRASCRDHNTTVTGLIQALVLVSLSSRLHSTAAKAFKSTTALNLRRWMGSKPAGNPCLEPEQTMANYATHMTHTFDAKLVSSIRASLATDGDSSREKPKPLPLNMLDQVWIVAARARRDIEEKLDLGAKNDHVGLMRCVPGRQRRMRDAERRPREVSWSVANLGVIDGEIEGRPESIKYAQYTSSAEASGAALVVSLVTVKETELCVTMTWQQCAMDERLAAHVLYDMEEWLGQIASIKRGPPRWPADLEFIEYPTVVS
ncbi:uncharacterized protein F4807DRAFT_471162 [Annulohypoxylon truncatum]|uniref:uncharacterized protein n=1 Tax=Annulohypoxylon truncatum TaxID=327061 RepID=UPI00200741E4|nr:uncharacterized protein F4807DRAFT_471162 [Annulohypoxylon truncatum]KAI1205310.1 hypothetical protein F4807DRAFT_471162 [Annulohypoxylon truncatum]